MRRPRKKKVITDCPHTDRPHYSKGMCNHCYHTHGRNSFATACQHTSKMNYAKGLCKNCYLNSYNRIKKKEELNKQSIIEAKLAEIDEKLGNQKNLDYHPH